MHNKYISHSAEIRSHSVYIAVLLRCTSTESSALMLEPEGKHKENTGKCEEKGEGEQEEDNIEDEEEQLFKQV